MKDIFRKQNILIGLFLLMLGLTACTPQESSRVETENATENATQTSEILSAENTETSALEIHFLNVGQGDATLIKCGGQSMLIDAGPAEAGTKLQLYLMEQDIEELDYLVLTHPDADHIGGGDVIVTKYDIGTVFMGDYEKEGANYEELVNALAYKNEKYTLPKVGSTYQLGEAEFTILAPNQIYEDANNNSIALLLTHGENTILFTGDCKAEAESDIMSNGLNIDCDVYKVAHHGSGSSSSKEFLEAISPQAAVISCGANDYGHPHEEVLNSLKEMGVAVYRTDEQGAVVVCSDGNHLTWNCQPSQTWHAGENVLADADAMGDSLAATVAQDYIIANKKSGVFHKSTCKGLPAEGNQILFETKEKAIESGFSNPCNYCRP